jgi:uncharacterized membrane protein YiaA
MFLQNKSNNMEDKEQPFSPEDSLRVIHQTIEVAKRRVQENGFYLLLWGTLVVIAGFWDFFIEWNAQDTINTHLPWMLMPVVGITATIVYEIRRQRTHVERNTFNTLYGMTWLGYGITVPLLMVYVIKANLSPTPPILAMTGFALFISGLVLQFRPIIGGAVVIWVGALLAIFAEPIWHSLIMAVVTGIGYLIPGYLLNRSKRA